MSERIGTAIGQEQKAMADRFLALHRMQRPFVLANSWDVVTAKVFAQEGFPAIGTSSYATAATLGLPDGQSFPLQETVELVRRLVQRVGLPVNADIEAGYADTLDGVVESARAVLSAGAVGINLEDSTRNEAKPLHDIGFQCDRIAAIRAMADALGIHLVINARTDVYLVGTEPGSRLDQAIARGRAYAEAGADCVFVPDMGDLGAEEMRQLVERIRVPINVIAGPSLPSIGELGEIGIARVSLGPRVMRAALGLYKRIAREILDQGTFSRVFADCLTYEETHRLLAEREG
jgi:2-methylisocitrate lyase-like PEP mutase family enzyme